MVSPLPKFCGCPHPCPDVSLFLATISISIAKVSALAHPGVVQVVTHNLLHLCLSSSSNFISPIALPL